ncbi:hypothetical protein AX15_007937 [Amanita polypyramis BW_CC]|nr:hypothetical protein AX15_007937 [Amanita polypyramis BW_CC]
MAASDSSLSWAERARKANSAKQPAARPIHQPSQPQLQQPHHSLHHNSPPRPPANGSPIEDPKPQQKPPVLNVWDVRKEQMAAAAARSTSQRSAPSTSAPLPAQPTQDPSADAPPMEASQSAPTESTPNKSASVLTTDPDDDPFVVRIPPNRERNPITVPTLDDSEAWPEVGKSSTVKSNKAPEKDDHDCREPSHPAGATPKKSEKKWIPLSAEEWQGSAEHKQRPHSNKNGHFGPAHHSKNLHTINGASSSTAQSRNHSGHNSVSQSASQSRINSRTGSVQSSPCVPRNKRLPQDESIVPPSDANLIPNGSLAFAPGMQPYAETHPGASGHVPMAYPTPVYGADTGLAPYYSRQHPSFPPHHYSYSSAHSPSNASYRSSHDNTPPIYPPPPPIHYPGVGAPYSMYPPYGPYDYGMTSPQQSYPYWNGNLAEPNQSYSAPYLPQVMGSPRPPMQQYNVPSSSSSQSERYVQQSDRVPLPPERSQAVAGYVTATPLDEGNRKGAVAFGSIADSTRSPAPSFPHPSDEKVETIMETVEKKMAIFTIGMSESEVGHARLRSRTRSSKARSRTSMAGSPTVDAGEKLVVGAVEDIKVIDLTDKETTWKFGFAEGGVSPPVPPRELPSAPETQASSSAVTPLSSISASLPFDVSLASSLPSNHPSGVLAQNAPLGQDVTLQSDRDTDESDAFKVRDYGYGFGSGTNPVADGRDQKSMREHREKPERECAEQDQDREERTKDGYKSRRGGYGNYVYERGGGGYRRGRGSNGFTRGYNRGFHHRGGVHMPRHPQAPSQLASPSQFQSPILPMGDSANGYYTPSQPSFPYDAYGPAQVHSAPVQVPPPSASAPPLPAPQSQLSFPLDSTRYWLLGQLEYYLSPQNLAQDFYLRQQMDSKGWVAITTLASFNRVKNLTHDYQFVKDVLTLSMVLTVRGDYVRMHGWERFVLPNAAPSKVEPSEHDGGFAPDVGSEFIEYNSVAGNGDEAEHGEDLEEEEEEEDVVFVMGKEAGWSPQAARHHT